MLSQIRFPCRGFNTTPAISCHERKVCLVSHVTSVIHPVVPPYFSSLLLPSGWQLAALREQPCRRLLEGRLKFQCNHPCAPPGAGTHPSTKDDRKSCNNIPRVQPGDRLGRTAWSHRGNITYKMCEILIRAIFLHHIKKKNHYLKSLFNWIITLLGTKCKSQKTPLFSYRSAKGHIYVYITSHIELSWLRRSSIKHTFFSLALCWHWLFLSWLNDWPHGFAIEMGSGWEWTLTHLN